MAQLVTTGAKNGSANASWVLYYNAIFELEAGDDLPIAGNTILQPRLCLWLQRISKAAPRLKTCTTECVHVGQVCAGSR